MRAQGVKEPAEPLGPRRRETAILPGVQSSWGILRMQRSTSERAAPRTPRRRRHPGLAAALAAAAGLLGVLSDPLRGQDNERALFVSVLDDDGAPVPGLGPAEFVVEEDGVEREVLRTGPARSPMQVAVLVDTSASAAFAIRDIRNGLERLVPVLAERNDVALVSYGGPPRVLVESTRSVERLRDGIGLVFSFQESAGYLLDAMMETARGFERREAPRPAMVVVASEGLDFSRYDYRRTRDALQASGVTVHVVVVQARGNTALRGDPFSFSNEILQRDRALGQLPEATGGQRYDLLLSTAVPDAMDALAEVMTNQYRVVYSRPPELIPPETISVRMRRADLTARGTPDLWTGDGSP